MNNVIKFVEFESGIEFYTIRTTGESGMSQTGLAKLCGVSRQTINELVKEIHLSGSRVPELLKPLATKGFKLESLSGELNNAYVLSDEACALIIEFYAFDSRNKSESALAVFRKFAQAGIRKWIQTITDWDINHVKTIEETIQDQICDLASYSNIKLRKEVTVLNHLTDTSAKTRRFDIAQNVGGHKKIRRIWELKSHRITVEDLAGTIGTKGYIHLAQMKYPKNTIDFIFMSPFGITEEAKRMLDHMPEVRYMEVSELMDHLLNNVKKNTPVQGHWYISEHIVPRFIKYLPRPVVVPTITAPILKQAVTQTC